MSTLILHTVLHEYELIILNKYFHVLFYIHFFSSIVNIPTRDLKHFPLINLLILKHKLRDSSYTYQCFYGIFNLREMILTLSFPPSYSNMSWVLSRNCNVYLNGISLNPRDIWRLLSHGNIEKFFSKFWPIVSVLERFGEPRILDYDF